jgi:hypothetical protein
MIGTIKINLDFSCGLMDPKLFGAMLCCLPSDARIKGMEVFVKNHFDHETSQLEIDIESTFFTSEGEIIAQFRRDVSEPEGRSLPVSHDHFVGFDFSEVTK